MEEAELHAEVRRCLAELHEAAASVPAAVVRPAAPAPTAPPAAPATARQTLLDVVAAGDDDAADDDAPLLSIHATRRAAPAASGRGSPGPLPASASASASPAPSSPASIAASSLQPADAGRLAASLDRLVALATDRRRGPLFCRQHYARAAAAVLSEAVLVPLARQQLLGRADALFLAPSIPAQSQLTALAAGWAAARHSLQKEALLRLCDAFVAGGHLRRLVGEAAAAASSPPPNLTPLTTVLAALPDRIANSLQGQLSRPALQPRGFYRALVAQTLDAVLQPASLQHDPDRRWLAAVAGAVLGKAALQGHADTVAKNIAQRLTASLRSPHPTAPVGSPPLDAPPSTSSPSPPSSSSPSSSSVPSCPVAAVEMVQQLRAVLDTLPGQSLEPLLTSCLQHFARCCEPGQAMAVALFARGARSNAKLRFLLGNKLLFVRSFPDTAVAREVVGILATASRDADDDTLLLEPLLALLRHWGSQDTIRRCSHQQHLYISKARICLVLATRFLTKRQLERHADELLLGVMRGTQNIIPCPVQATRSTGLATAMLIVELVSPDKPLKLEVDDTADVKLLRQLAKETDVFHAPAAAAAYALFEGHTPPAGSMPAPAPVPPPLQPGGDNRHLTPASIGISTAPATVGFSVPAKPSRGDDPSGLFFAKPHPELDSDDDSSDDEFQAYHMGAEDVDEEEEKLRRHMPVYLRDCLKGMRSSDDAVRYEASFRAAETLIRSNPGELREVADELMQVLLHSTNRYSQEEFVQQRMGAMVATAVLQPETSSAVLCREFYGDNYTLAQRLDMLHVLEAASKELAANPVAAVAPGAPLRRAPQDVQRVQAKLRYEQHNARRAAAAAEPSALDKARALVQQRLEAKTRRFSKGPSRPAAIAAPNAFAPVAGHFFFPLLQLYDRPNNTFDLLGKDAFVLAKLVQTLGAVLFSAGSAPIARSMSVAMAELILVLRMHGDAQVRRALLYAFFVILQIVPMSLLLSDMPAELGELRLWVQDRAREDPDTMCRELAMLGLYELQERAVPK